MGIVRKLCFAKGLCVFLLGFSIATEVIASDDVIEGVSTESIRDDLSKQFTQSIGGMLANKKQRDAYLKQLYVLQGIKQRAETLTPLEKENIRAELALREYEILRDALIKHELEAENLNIESLAKERYEVKKEEYKTRRQIKLSQIFLSKEPGKRKDAKKEAFDILEQLKEDNLRIHEEKKADEFADNDVAKSDVAKDKSAEDKLRENLSKFKIDDENDLYSQLAKKHSDDPLASQGGFNPKWILEPTSPDAYKNPVIKAAFDLLVKGEISDVIESDAGFHILRLMDYKPNKQLEFDEVKADIISEIRNNLWLVRQKGLIESLQPPKSVEINDELALKILEEVYTERDASLKEDKEKAVEKEKTE